jgi:hypothetical protein
MSATTRRNHFLTLAEPGLAAQDFGVTEHRVQRRAQLVAHAGEEHALGLAGDLGALLCRRQFGGALTNLLLELVAVLAQLFLRMLALRNVGDEGLEVDRMACVVAHRAHAGRQPDLSPVLAVEEQVSSADRAAFEHLMKKPRALCLVDVQLPADVGCRCQQLLW